MFPIPARALRLPPSLTGLSRPFAVLLVALPVVAFAQANAVVHLDPSRGVTLLPTSVAFTDDATAIAINPAGLSKVGSVELFWAHERSIARDQIVDGLYFGSSPISSLGLGLSLEWVRNGAQSVTWRKTGLGLAYGGEPFSVGLAFTFFNGGPVDGMVSADLGVQSRLARYFSAGVSVKNVDSPTRGALQMPRSWDFGVGVRPFGERITVGVDWILNEVDPIAASRLAYSVKAEVFKGIYVQLGFSHDFRSADGLYFQGGIVLDTQHFGASYALSYAFDGPLTGEGHLTTARLSLDPYRAVPIRSSKIAVVSLEGLGQPNTGGTVGSLLGVTGTDRYLRLMRSLEEGLTDSSLKGVIVKVEASGLKLARAFELRQMLMRLRAAGKVVVSLILSADDPEYVIASAADKVYSVPEAMLIVDGLQSNVVFLGGTAQKLGVTVDVARVGAYKNSPDQFTRTSMSAEQKEAINAYLDVDVKAIDAIVPGARGLTLEQWHAAVDEGIKSVKRAKQLMLIDDVVSTQQLEELLPQLIPGAQLVKNYNAKEERDDRWGNGTRIAVIPVLGTISGGSDSIDPLGLALMSGADTFIHNLDAASRDPNVAAIVLRVDSPGGDGLASDMMYRAVLDAKRRKPVVASMGDIAASGGYYVAMGADEIFASPTTVTGSIGVFYLKPAVKALGESLGAHQESISRGKLSGALDYWEPWDPAHRASVQKWIDDFYETFITEVASSRKTTRDAIDAVARGRVWSGEDARAKGLVDTMGGLSEAIASAKARAGVANEDLEVSIYGPSRGLLQSVLGDGAVAKALRETRLESPSTLPAATQRLGAQLGADLLIGSPGIQARLEYQFDVR